MSIEIRLATESDADAVADYHHRCFLQTYAAQILADDIDVPDPEGTRLQLHEWFQTASEFETYVAVVADTPIGHFTILDHQLVHLFVEPEHQGTGLGRRLLADAEAMIAARGYDALELHARVENVAAISFYEHAGWAVTERLIRTVEHGISYDEHVLVKRLA